MVPRFVTTVWYLRDDLSSNVVEAVGAVITALNTLAEVVASIVIPTGIHTVV